MEDIVNKIKYAHNSIMDSENGVYLLLEAITFMVKRYAGRYGRWHNSKDKMKLDAFIAIKNELMKAGKGNENTNSISVSKKADIAGT